MSPEAWVKWAREYIDALDESPWRDFCIRESYRVQGVYALSVVMAERRRKIDQVVEAMASLDK